jgi:hypothetical protein
MLPINELITQGQYYPTGTHKNYNSFSSRNLMVGKGKELEYPEQLGEGKGEPGFPYLGSDFSNDLK